MVEISLSGSGEGLGGVILRGYSTYTGGTVRIDGAILAGITSREPSLGVTAGFT